MSEDGFSDSFDEPNMEIQIDTLLGTSFDMRCSSTDTVREIKQRIQRVEGIPVHQQNLIFQSTELKDSRRLCDAGIKNGSTIKLVTTMKGGPISTRRLSVSCEHHMVLKELKELLENTRDEIGDKLTPGSKVSVLVFKEGEILNLLRVIENEDGSYSPYSEKPISPPTKPSRKETHMAMFEKLVEDTDMMTKISNLRKKMEDVTLRKQKKSTRRDRNSFGAAGSDKFDRLFGEASSDDGKGNVSYKLLAECSNDMLDNIDLKIYEKNLEDGHSETEEIALKDKHRIKPHRKAGINKSLYSESKGVLSHTKQNYARMHKKTRELRETDSTLLTRERKTTAEDSGLFSIEDRDAETTDFRLPYNEPLAAVVSKQNTVHLTRLVLAEGVDRPKSSPDSIELEENAQDLWEIHEAATDRLKHCNFGVLKRRQSLDYAFDEVDNSAKIKQEIGEYNYCNKSDFEVCSGNFFHMPHLVSPSSIPVSPSAIPQQYTPKDQQSSCDYFFSNNNRSPLYGRKTKTDDTSTSTSTAASRKNDDYAKSVPKLPEIKNDRYGGGGGAAAAGFLSDCSSIQRLKNDCGGTDSSSKSLSDSLFSEHDESIDKIYGYYNLGCAAELLGEKVSLAAESKKSLEIELPPVIKKKARCSECNKRLNITNIYNCRCGKIFCSQHRYSEVHRCSYDYKSEGRKILEHQNPLVTAEKVHRI